VGSGELPSGRSSNTDAESLENAMGCEDSANETASGRRSWLNMDPIGERGGINLYGFVGNDPVNWIDSLGLEFVYKGPDADKYQALIDCWKSRLNKNSLLRKIVNDLDKSKRKIRIKNNKLKLAGGDPAPLPATQADLFNSGDGRDTTTYIDAKSYTTDGRTWTFPEALAHELLHAHDFQSADPNVYDRSHNDEGWKKDERDVTHDALNAK
jgi:uncharacterized protein RhaS with RHS repeats